MRNLWENAPKRDPEHSPRRGREKYHGFVVKIPKKVPEKGPRALTAGGEREISRFCGKKPPKSALKGTLSTHRGGGRGKYEEFVGKCPKKGTPEHSARRGGEKYHEFVGKSPKKAPEKGP